jgi:signal transduction histidine kinase
VNGAIELRFVDNGLGIDLKRHGEKIFGMYKTFHTNPDSKGLGLFMVKNQVEAMGGVISVESEVNVGTTFIVRLPRKPDRS